MQVMDSHLLLVRQIDALSGGRPTQQVVADVHLKQMFSKAVHVMNHLSGIGITDANGRVLLAAGAVIPKGEATADRDYFSAPRAGHVGLFVSQPFMQPSGERHFALSIARAKPNGEFTGIVYTTVRIDYFTSFWKQFAPSAGYLVPLIRADGTVLARYPALDNPERFPPNGPFLTRIRQSESGIYTAVSLVDGVERTNAYTKVGTLPLLRRGSMTGETSAAVTLGVEEFVSVRFWP